MESGSWKYERFEVPPGIPGVLEPERKGLSGSWVRVERGRWVRMGGGPISFDLEYRCEDGVDT